MRLLLSFRPSNAMPTSALTENANTIDVSEINDGQCRVTAMTLAAPIPVRIPMTPPTELNEIASIKN